MAETDPEKPPVPAQILGDSGLNKPAAERETARQQLPQNEPLLAEPVLPALPVTPAATGDTFAPREVAERTAEHARRRLASVEASTRRAARRPETNPAVIVAVILGPVVVVLLLAGAVGWWYFEQQRPAPAVAVGPVAAAPAPLPDKWQTFTTPQGGGFTVSFPGRPKHTRSPSQNTPRTLHAFEVEDGQANFSVVCWDPPLSGPPPQLFQSLRSVRQDFPLGQIGAERQLTLGSYSGWEFVIHFENLTIVQRSYAGHGRTFTVRVSAPKLDPIAADVDRFLGSFRPSDMDRTEPGGVIPGGVIPAKRPQLPPTLLHGSPSEVLCVGFARDGNTLLAAAQNGELTTFDVATAQCRSVTPFPRKGARFLAFELSADRTAAAAGTLGAHFYLLDLEPYRDRAILIKLLPEGVAWAVAYSADGKFVASAHDKSARVWSVAEQKLQSQLDQGERVNALAFSPDGKTVATGTKDNRITLWDLDTGTTRHTLVGKKGGVASAGALWAVAWSPDGTTLAAGGNDHTVRLWDVGTRRERALLPHDQTVRSVVFSPDGKLLATGDDAGAVALWDAERGTRKAVFAAESPARAVRALAFAPNSTHLAASRALEVLLWRLGDVRWDDTGREE